MRGIAVGIARPKRQSPVCRLRSSTSSQESWAAHRRKQPVACLPSLKSLQGRSYARFGYSDADFRASVQPAPAGLAGSFCLGRWRRHDRGTDSHRSGYGVRAANEQSLRDSRPIRLGGMGMAPASRLGRHQGARGGRALMPVCSKSRGSRQLNPDGNQPRARTGAPARAGSRRHPRRRFLVDRCPRA